MLNRLANINNQYQRFNDHKRVLCVCSAGLLRSPTIAFVLSLPPYNFNTRAAGAVQEYALVYADDVLVNWADEIVCANHDHFQMITDRFPDMTVINLNIPDIYEYRNEELINLIRDRYDEASKVGA